IFAARHFLGGSARLSNVNDFPGIGTISEFYILYTRYYLSVISAFLIYGLFSIPLKTLDDYASLDILLSRLLFASVLLLVISATFRRRHSIRNITIYREMTRKEKNQSLLVNGVSAVMLAANWYIFIFVMNRISVNATSLAYMLCPIITTILAYVFLGDRLSRVQWIAVFLSLCSCIMLGFGELRDVFYSFIIGLTYAIYLVLQKNNMQLDRFFTLTFQIVVASLILAPFFGYQEPLPEKGFYFYGIIFLIAGFFTILPMFLNVYALNKLSSSTAGIFIYLNPILSFLLAIFYFHEPMSQLKIWAYSIVFFSVILFNSELLYQLMLKPVRE